VIETNRLELIKSYKKLYKKLILKALLLSKKTKGVK